MRLTSVDILANWYNDETLPWSAQKAVNYIAETAEVGGTRSVSKVKGLPGLDTLVDLMTSAPIRGAEDVEGTLFVVSGTSLFQIGLDLSVTNRGNIPGVSLVSMAHNKQGGTTAANELVIANGLSGYVYNTETTVLSQITDDAFPGASTFDYVDGYMSFTDPEGRFWGHSALNQATQYSSIDRYDAESAPDKIVSHIVSHREVMVFGTRTTEFFRNTGAATGTFQRVDGTEMEVGIAAPLARARMDNTVYWLGSDGLVYRLAGHSPQRVSTRPIEQAISRFNIANAFAHTWEDRGHQVFYLTFPDGLTFGFDVATGLWHARETYGLERWGYNTTTKWNGMWVAGHYSDGKLYALNWDTYTEGGLPLVAECCPGVTHADGNDVLCPYTELFMDTGVGSLPALFLSGDLPDANVGDSGTYSYTATGGIAPYTFSIVSGSLPPGATMDSAGEVTFDYTNPGSYSWTVQVEDSFGQFAYLDDTAQISVNGPWFYGPVNQNGISGGPMNYYLKTTDPTDWTDPPIVLPNSMADLGRISTANGALFFHGGTVPTLGNVSFDGGLTFTTLNVRLNVDADVYWNGTNYYCGSQQSADGITWVTITNLPGTAIGGTAFARTSDGAICIADALGQVHVSLNNGTTWTPKAMPFGAPVEASVESNGVRISASMPAGIGFGYTDNLFTSVTSVPGMGFSGYTDERNGTFIGRAATDVRRSLTLESGSFSNVLTGQGTVGSTSHTIAHSSTQWCSLKQVGAGQFQVNVSDDDGVVWTEVPTILYGNGSNIAFPRDE